MSNSPRKTKPADVLATLRAKKPNRVSAPMVFDNDARNELINARRLARVSLNAHDAAVEAREAADQTDDVDALDQNVAKTKTAAEDAAAQLEAAELAAEPHTVEFVFEALGSSRMAEIRAEHPPTKAQRSAFMAEAKAAGLPKSRWAGPDFNPDTYPLALTLECLVEPEMTGDEFLELVWHNPAFSEAELGQLFGAAFRACTETGAMPAQ